MAPPHHSQLLLGRQRDPRTEQRRQQTNSWRLSPCDLFRDATARGKERERRCNGNVVRAIIHPPSEQLSSPYRRACAYAASIHVHAYWSTSYPLHAHTRTSVQHARTHPSAYSRTPAARRGLWHILEPRKGEPHNLMHFWSTSRTVMTTAWSGFALWNKGERRATKRRGAKPGGGERVTAAPTP